MPGLRHAHTLQQLKDVYEYSPPGEYLINKTKRTTYSFIKKTKQKNKSTNIKHI